MTEYIIAVEDLFRVEADSPEEAKQEALTRFGEDGWIPTDVEIVDSFED